MATLNVLFPILMLLIFTSCQVKNGATSDGLIAGHKPTTNKFSIVNSAAKTYVASEDVVITVSFPFDIIMDTTGGSPRLRLTIGATTRYADFDSQSDPKNLTFKYTTVSGDNDSNGIDVSALELNGSTLKFDKDGTPTDCDVSTLASKNLANQKVDTASPSISGFSLMNVPGLYNEGEKLNFAMTFSEAVYVTGAPTFSMTIGGSTVDVDYLSGSGSTLLAFSYTVAGTDADGNGYDSITSPLDLNGGTLKDIVGNDSSLDFSAFTAGVIAYSSNVIINGQYPYVVGAIFPAEGTYVAAQDLDFTLVFDRQVTVTGTPYINVNIGSNTRQAQYIAGSGTEQITFRYTAVPGDVDTDGISVTGSIAQNAGNIVDTAVPTSSYFSQPLNNSYSVPDTSKIILNALQPQATAVSRNIDSTIPVWGGPAVDNVWMTGQELNITISFNTGMYVTQTSGTPSIPLTIGATTRQATYLSGGNGQTSLVFRYVIQDGDLDTDGTIAIGDILLNGGVITDSANTNTLLTLPVAGLLTTRVDAVKPTIASVTAPANGTYSQVTPMNAAAMSFVVNWSEPVNYSSTAAGAAYLSMDIGGTNVRAEYAASNNSAAISHRPTTLANRNDANGIALSSPLAGTAIIKDQAGNTATVFTYTPPSTGSILVDTTAPTVTSVTQVTANGTHNAGDTLDFSVTFSEPVTPSTISGNYPGISVVVGSTTRYLQPTGTSRSATQTFRYTVQANDEDVNGVAVGTALQSNAAGHVRDDGRNNVTGTFTAPNTSSLRVDAVAPTVISVSASANKAYVSGEVLSITIEFSENVTVTGGTPYIGVDFTQGTDNFNYASGSGTDTLVFSRTLTGSHFDMNGLPASIDTITLPVGVLIQDIGTNDAPSTFTAQNMSQVYVTYPEVKLWVKANFQNIAPPANAVAVTNNGAVDTVACGSGTCRTFDGTTDSLYLNGSLNNVRTVFMAYRLPGTVTTDRDMFGTDITINADTTGFPDDYDLTTANGNLYYNGSNLGIGTNHAVDSAPSSTNYIQVDFQSAQSYNSEYLIQTDFNGAIGEIIVIDGTTLTTTEEGYIRAYLNGAY